MKKKWEWIVISLTVIISFSISVGLSLLLLKFMGIKSTLGLLLFCCFMIVVTIALGKYIEQRFVKKNNDNRN